MVRFQWDIFCKIVDNFGDIGVCWRLAKQLQLEHAISVRLWVDDINAAKHLIPNLNASAMMQTIEGVLIAQWREDTLFLDAADVVIEAFGCTLPETYMQQMHEKTIWVNLEYLSAESWVDNFHGKCSIQNHLRRHFFFPGFTWMTGGLIREKSALLHDVEPHQLLQTLLMNEVESLKISLFCYPHAPLIDLLTAFSMSQPAIMCYVPESSLLSEIAFFFDKTTLQVGDVVNKGQLQLQVLPFLSQNQYDQLLRTCDINFVRGEDSWVRAIWAGKPFVWQPYLQDESAHLKKLDAFLALYLNASKTVRQFHYVWLSSTLSSQDWSSFVDDLPQIRDLTLQQRNALVNQTDLVTNLVIFIENLIKTHV